MVRYGNTDNFDHISGTGVYLKDLFHREETLIHTFISASANNNTFLVRNKIINLSDQCGTMPSYLMFHKFYQLWCHDNCGQLFVTSVFVLDSKIQESRQIE